MEATECGAASLAMIFAFFGQYVPLEQMRIETGVSRDGCNAGNIMRAAKKYGLECHGYRKEPEDLKSLTMPCIIHWNFNHFVVLEGFKGKYVILNDPAEESSHRRSLTTASPVLYLRSRRPRTLSRKRKRIRCLRLFINT